MQLRRAVIRGALSAFFLVAYPAVAQVASFAPAVNYAAGANPIAVAVGDFNRDGISDIAVANPGNNNVSVRLGNRDGIFAAAGNFAVGGDPQAIVTIDLNGDGKLDLVTANYNTNDVSVLLGNGDGTFGPAVNYAAGSSPIALAVGDFNGDGVPDLAVVDYMYNGTFDGRISILLGKTGGTFQPPVNYTVGITPRSVAVGDINGDGRADLVVTNINSNDVSVLLGKGDGTFQAAANYSTGGFSAPFSVAIADLNGDGKSDVVVADGYRSSISVLLGKGDGTLLPEVEYTVGPNPLSVIIGDFNGDGKLDLATANNAADNVSILSGNGDGSFAAPINFAVGTRPYFVAAGDFNGDGKLDLAVVNNGTASISGSVSVLLNQTLAPQSGCLAAPVNGPVAQVAADFNGDGKIDLASPDLANNLVNLFLGNGDGTFQAPLTSSAGIDPEYMVAGDFNRDGKLDIAVINYGFQALTVLTGNGNGTFTSKPGPAVGAAPQSIAAGDFNGDGKIDLVVGNRAENSISVMLGNGDSTFQTAVNTSLGNNKFPDSLVVGDFNRDGKLDIATANPGDGTVSVLLGKGDGTFHTPVFFPGGLNLVSLVSGDFNRDGKSDLAVLNRGTAVIATLLGDGNGGFSSQQGPGIFAAPASIAIADVNNDGEPDLLFTVLQDPLIPIAGMVEELPGNGDGSFQAAVPYPDAFASTRIVVADFNRDGRLDIATGGSILLNQACPGPATHFNLTAPGAVTAGTQFNIGVTALDQFETIATGYSGTLHFSSSDPIAILPGNSTLSSGMGTFHVTLKKAGAQAIYATDTLNPSITNGTLVKVNSAAATHFVIAAPHDTIPAVAFTVTVTAQDVFSNTDANYTGTITFVSSDSAATLPAPYTFSIGVGGDNGEHTFSNMVTLNTLGQQTISGTDGASNSGSASVAVNDNTTVISSLSNPSFFRRDPVTLTATVMQATGNIVPGGTLQFYDGPILLGSASLNAGVGSITVPYIKLGIHVVYAMYVPSNGFTTSRSAPLLYRRWFVP